MGDIDGTSFVPENLTREAHLRTALSEMVEQDGLAEVERFMRRWWRQNGPHGCVILSGRTT